MDQPIKAANTPYATPVEAGKNYSWCACGASKGQPFCDQACAGTEYNPVEYKATETKTVHFCGCKKTKTAPLCDGSHSK